MSLEVDSLKIARIIFGSKVGKAVLRRLLEEDPSGFRSRLEHVLEMFAKGKGRVSFSCTLDYYFYKLLLETSIKFMHMSKEEFLEGIKDPAIRRGMELVFRSLLKYGVTVPQRLAAPFLIVWNFTNACNLRCKHCYQNADSNPGVGELTLEEKMMAIEQIDELGIPVIALSGGEPTIHPDFLEVVEEGARRGIYMAVATNGIRFAEEDFTRRAIQAGLRYVEVSLDSVDPKKHNGFRGVDGAWEKAVKGLINVIKLGNGKVSTGIAMTVTRLNMDEVKDMMRLGEELGVTRVIFFNFIPTGRGKEINELDLTPEEREEVLKQIYMGSIGSKVQKVSTAPQLARVSWKMSSEEDVLPTHFTVPRSKSLKALAEFIGGCGAGRIYLALQPDGTVTPCVFLPMPVGNLRKDRLREIWEKNKVINDLKNKDLLKQPCGSCKFKYICGGCRARAYAYFGDYLAPDPGCLKGKQYLEEGPWMLAVAETS
ncbi:MAG: radical SAM protein [Aigarchaeota archaeon]|nr:radical SAM protein [Aigarchaeota archaeon]